MPDHLHVTWTVSQDPAEALATAIDAVPRREGEAPARIVEATAESLTIRWEGPSWAAADVSLTLRGGSAPEGAELSVEVRGITEALPFSGEDATAWFASQVVARLAEVADPRVLGDWLTDRRARRPSGAEARAFYRDPRWHRPPFDAVLERLALGPDDRLIDVGCGGGAFLAAALERAAAAAGVDHSAEMIETAAERNAVALEAGRLELSHASAAALPFASERFTCATMIGVLPWLDDQLGALRELRRLLVRGGRLVLYTGSPAIAGTAAAPAPFAARLHLLTDDELAGLAERAGFGGVAVARPDLREQARERGFAGAELDLFAGPYGQILTAIG